MHTWSLSRCWQKKWQWQVRSAGRSTCACANLGVCVSVCFTQPATEQAMVEGSIQQGHACAAGIQATLMSSTSYLQQHTYTSTHCAAMATNHMSALDRWGQSDAPACAGGPCPAKLSTLAHSCNLHGVSYPLSDQGLELLVRAAAMLLLMCLPHCRPEGRSHRGGESTAQQLRWRQAVHSKAKVTFCLQPSAGLVLCRAIP